MESFEAFFQQTTTLRQPYAWQRALARESPKNRLIRIPTGFGKTLGVLSAWIWNRVRRHDESWPRRLVWCLPMRVLVEQTRDEAENCLKRLGILWDGDSQSRSGLVGVHLLMGGSDAGEWHLHPEHCSVLIGTQDMLLSRAMNRGYAAPRARWPMEFGLLNQDCLWVMDEVQLMDVGLATSGQLQAFRGDDANAGKALRPSFTWWMSATLQKDWLAKSRHRGRGVRFPAHRLRNRCEGSLRVRRVAAGPDATGRGGDGAVLDGADPASSQGIRAVPVGPAGNAGAGRRLAGQ